MAQAELHAEARVARACAKPRPSIAIVAIIKAIIVITTITMSAIMLGMITIKLMAIRRVITILLVIMRITVAIVFVETGDEGMKVQESGARGFVRDIAHKKHLNAMEPSPVAGT